MRKGEGEPGNEARFQHGQCLRETYQRSSNPSNSYANHYTKVIVVRLSVRAGGDRESMLSAGTFQREAILF